MVLVIASIVLAALFVWFECKTEPKFAHLDGELVVDATAETASAGPGEEDTQPCWMPPQSADLKEAA